ncbi:hypothetical protein LOK49_LG05G01275 [Camellia lanceoleosa]|uniref:Uncharacterized protein n=1 Tax=Camellia lanceoleosa TaxID=1840588 RepID=A0ACC0HT88_9ERIC|nr:hypothetical protein LOK49_LG05G01275 [Camellia lanceoleosa]
MQQSKLTYHAFHLSQNSLTLHTHTQTIFELHCVQIRPCLCILIRIWEVHKRVNHSRNFNVHMRLKGLTWPLAVTLNYQMLSRSLGQAVALVCTLSLDETWP